MKGGRKMRSSLQFRIVQMELLGNLPPVLRIEVVVSTTLIRRSFLNETESGCLRYPNLLLRMISPLSGIPGEATNTLGFFIDCLIHYFK